MPTLEGVVGVVGVVDVVGVVGVDLYSLQPTLKPPRPKKQDRVKTREWFFG